ncbi:MAG: hypothetical protein J6W28_04725 [Clostridia bacterium]|nr:hypothetical protein [Clostridia bacterium]
MAETKNLLTREYVKEELLKTQKYHFYHVLFLFFGALPFIALCLWGGIYLTLHGSIFCIGLPILTGVTLLLALYLLISKGVALSKARRGVFSLVTDQVSEKTEELVYAGRHRRLEQVLYFVHYGRYLPSDTVYQLTDMGDTFYLVVIDGRKPTIAKAYHTKFYTDRERSY